jgi:hypothetical protein
MQMKQLLVGALLLSGCAYSVAVERVQVRDHTLRCDQIRAELQEADRFRQAAEANKGVKAANTAAVLLFWPALITTYADANEAIRAADERKAHLIKLYDEKHCGSSPH